MTLGRCRRAYPPCLYPLRKDPEKEEDVLCFRRYGLGYVSKNEVVKHGDIAPPTVGVPLARPLQNKAHTKKTMGLMSVVVMEGIDGQNQRPNRFETILLDQNQSFPSMHMVNDQDSWISNSILVLQASNRGLYLWHLRTVIRCTTVYVHRGIITLKYYNSRFQPVLAGGDRVRSNDQIPNLGSFALIPHGL
jgi:hypothetical protein